MPNPTFPAEKREATPTSGEILVFSVEGHRFALRVAEVREVARSVAITPLPGTPRFVEGVVDLRGTLAPVYDIRSRLGLRPRANDPADRLVFAWCGGRIVALRVDEVIGLVDIGPEDFMETVATEHVAGIARLPDGLVLLHNLAAFLSGTESEQLDHALAGLRERTARAAA